MTTLYRAYDAAGELLYVGITDDYKRRRRQHELRAPWRAYVARWTTEQYPSRDAAEAAELTAIHYEAPRWNTVGNERNRGAALIAQAVAPEHLGDVPPETRRAVEARFCADLAREHPGTVWHVEAGE